MKPTAERVRQLFAYDPFTGLFTWRIPMKRQRMKIGAKAGCKSSDGGWRLKVDGEEFPAGVIAFLYMIGRLPEGDVDHEDRDRSNNRWANLRETVERMFNCANRGNFEHSAPHKGVSYYPNRNLRKRYRARIRVHGKLIDLGWFETSELGHLAYMDAARKHFGDFANPG
jgi:hypothetical protein